MKRPDNRVGVRLHRSATVAVAAGLVLTGLVLAGCGGEGPGSGAAPVAQAAAGSPTGAGSTVTSSPVLVDPLRAQSLVRDGAVLIDVRTPEEFDEVRIDGAVLVDIASATFEDQLAALDPTAAYVVYCRTGNRSAAATARMAQLGFAEVYDAGGIQDWVAQGLPVVRG